LQSPQVAGLVSVSTHDPAQLESMPGQLVVHSLLLQTSSSAQEISQSPQKEGLLSVLTQTPPQLSMPSLQLKLHSPAAQPALPLMGASHFASQSPQ
jgi:hypothetical protein